MHFYLAIFNCILFLISYVPLIHGQCSSMRVRKPFEELSSSERATLVDAFWRMKENGFMDRITRKHRSGMRYHGTPHFMIMHRALVKEMEDELLRVAPSLQGIPFWNEVEDITNPQSSIVFTSTSFAALKDGDLGPPFVGYLDDRQRNVTRKPRKNSSRISWLPQNQVIARALQRFTTYGNMSRAIEVSPHNQMHAFIGGNMGNPTISPSDPIFWLHHAYIDLLWAIWQSLNPSHVEQLNYFNGTAINPGAPAAVYEDRYTNLDVTRYLRLCYRYSLPRRLQRRNCHRTVTFKKVQPLCPVDIEHLMPNVPISQFRAVEDWMNNIVDELNNEIQSGKKYLSQLDTIESLYARFQNVGALTRDDFKFSLIPAIQKLHKHSTSCA
ncbi:hypothetical protein HMI54_013230 [Coelomomyces lativittatus]|nr:hypothetical protein HMI56_002479 [Coelomomyces lativittatus]KAJ1514904.1 hypothetical protein HMI54_013230 [Coelomomyces lativittatus]KAJ1515207.1 hypothetical protein HMI55_003941 [Coelomomyces lativittatus]